MLFLGHSYTIGKERKIQENRTIPKARPPWRAICFIFAGLCLIGFGGSGGGLFAGGTIASGTAAGGTVTGGTITGGTITGGTIPGGTIARGTIASGTIAAGPAANGKGTDKRMPSAIDLRIMTFNIQHGKGLDGKVDLPRIARVIASEQPDVVALQEVDRYQPRSGFQDQAARLAKMLGMYGCFAPSLKFGFIQYGNLILSKYPIVGQRTVYMKGISERRSVLLADILVDGETVTVANTHLGVLDREREKQLPVLLATVAPLEQQTILLGDFNMGAQSERLRPFAKAFRKIGLSLHQPTHRQAEIDHIYAGMGLISGKAWVEPTAASDHNPVIADLRFRSFSAAAAAGHPLSKTAT